MIKRLLLIGIVTFIIGMLSCFSDLAYFGPHEHARSIAEVWVDFTAAMLLVIGCIVTCVAWLGAEVEAWSKP